MIDFEDAVKCAEENVLKLVKGAKNIVLESVTTSNDENLYEVVFSYNVDGGGGIDNFQSIEKRGDPYPGAGIRALAALIGTRKEIKVFLVDRKTGKFKGFKNYKER